MTATSNGVNPNETTLAGGWRQDVRAVPHGVYGADLPDMHAAMGATMNDEQRALLATVTADVTTAQAVTARASQAAYSAAAHGAINATARLAIVEALDSLRTASEELRKAALHE
jgi:hypothetical protein